MKANVCTVDRRDRRGKFGVLRDELLGCRFSTSKNLRHRAEGCGFHFVPVEVVCATDTAAHMILKPADLGEIHVHASREQPWHPFLIEAVELQ